MIRDDTQELGQARTAFALSAAVTILFNTALACAKDASTPLKLFMASLTGHDWTTQGIADVILFLGLGLVLMMMDRTGKLKPARVISFLAAAVVVAGVGLFSWYVFY